jgi:predicted ester cyclase
MKHTLLLGGVIALCLFASCNSAPSADNAAPKKDSTATMTENKTDRNKKIVMACMDGINTHDVNKVFKDCSTDFTEYQDGSVPPQKGDSAKQGLAGFLNAFPDMRSENAMYLADGNTVAVASDWTMTFKNDMGAMKATGKTAKYKDVDIFTLSDDGKITSHRSIYPMGALMMMVGVDMAKMQAMMDKDMKKDAKEKK